MTDRPCSHCRVLIDAEFLEDRVDLGLGCEALCGACSTVIEAEVAEEDLERYQGPIWEVESWR